MPLYIKLFIVLSETWTNKTLKKQTTDMYTIYYSNILILFMHVWSQIYNQA